MQIDAFPPWIIDKFHSTSLPWLLHRIGSSVRVHSMDTITYSALGAIPHYSHISSGKREHYGFPLKDFENDRWKGGISEQRSSGLWERIRESHFLIRFIHFLVSSNRVSFPTKRRSRLSVRGIKPNETRPPRTPGAASLSHEHRWIIS